MRHGRAKAARKTLQYFSRTIGLKAPYWVLLDSNFVAALFQYQIVPVRERLDRILQTTGAAGINKYCIAQAALAELRAVNDDLQKAQHDKAAAFQEALEWIEKECIVLQKEEAQESSEDTPESDDENEKAMSAQDALMHHIENDDKPYIVATQDEDALHHLRNMGSVPIVRLANNSVLLLEHPSKQSQHQARGQERRKWKHGLADTEKALVDLVKSSAKKQSSTIGEQSNPAPQRHNQRTKTKAKGPNPLSCKRKQRPGDDANKASSSKKRRNRAKKQKTETTS